MILKASKFYPRARAIKINKKQLKLNFPNLLRYHINLKHQDLRILKVFNKGQSH